MYAYLFIFATILSMTSYAAIDLLKCTSGDKILVMNSSQVTGLANGYKLTTEDFNGVLVQNIDAFAGTRFLVKNNVQQLADRYIDEAQKATLQDHNPRIVISGKSEAQVLSFTTSGACKGPTFWVEEHTKFTQDFYVTEVVQIKNPQSGAWELKTSTGNQIFYCTDFMIRRTDEKPCP